MNKYKKKKKDFSKWIDCSFGENFKRDGYCVRGFHYLKCINNYQCYSCSAAEDLVKYNLSKPFPLSVIDEKSCLKHSGIGSNYAKKVVALTLDAMLYYGKDECLYYQMFYCVDGIGCFPGSPSAIVEGYFVSDPENVFTIQRSDIIGIPTFEVCKRYDNYYFTLTCKLCGYLKGVMSDDCNKAPLSSDEQLKIVF